MPREVSPPASTFTCRWLALGSLAVLAGALVIAGCGKPPVRSQKNPGAENSLATASTDEALDSANELLYKKTDHISCQAAIQQLNTYLSRNEKEKPQPLSAQEQARLEAVFAIDAEELAEINSATFTLLDAYYLETCFLWRDVARSLQVEGRSPLDQARAAFAWVMRQVRLNEKERLIVPDLFVLRRGRGTDLERARVFLTLLEQLGLEGCLLRIPNAQDPGLISRVLPGAIVDREVYLFDSKLGLPIAGPAGKGIATLTQLKKEPGLLAQFTVDPKQPYDIKPEQLQDAPVIWYCSLSALAPRMRVLETLLPDKNKVRLAIDHAAALGRVRAAVSASAAPVHTVDSAGRALPLARLLRYFLPTNEGGIDPGQPYPLQGLEGFAPAAREGEAPPMLRLNQMAFYQWELVPWKQFPESLRSLPWNSPQGLNVRGRFAGGFARIFIDAQGPRDLMLRGYFDEAMRTLTSDRDALEGYRQAASSDPTAETATVAWCDAVNRAYDALLRAQLDAQQNTPGAAEALKIAGENLELLDKLGQKRLPIVIVKALAPSIEAETAYIQALCKHEQAERLEAGLSRPGATPGQAEIQSARTAWESAASWWVSFESAHDSAAAVVHARSLHARACEALGQKATAITLLENLSGPVSAADMVSRLYRIQQLKR